MTTGTSAMTAQPMASPLREMPGPLDPVTATRPAQPAPMAMQAEAIREKRARIIKAEAELEASVKLSAAAAQIMANPAALELRRMQMISEVGAENNSTTVLMIPSDFVSLSHTLSEYLRLHSAPPAA